MLFWIFDCRNEDIPKCGVDIFTINKFVHASYSPCERIVGKLFGFSPVVEPPETINKRRISPSLAADGSIEFLTQIRHLHSMNGNRESRTVCGLLSGRQISIVHREKSTVSDHRHGVWRRSVVDSGRDEV